MKLLSNRDIYERVSLSQVIPLKTPLVVFIEPARSCNFKCNYCYHSFTKEQIEKMNFIKNGIMDYKLYTKIINDIRLFPNKLKCIHLTSRGEPLLNKKLPDMISFAKEKNVTDRINVVTNGSLLSPELNMDLINSGLDSIKISIQGIKKEDYRNIANVNINLTDFVDNIKHLYMNRKKCKVYIKIADLSIRDDDDRKKFYNMFSNICDGISIEHIFDTDDELNLKLNKKEDKNMYNKPIKNIEICPMPFYMLNIGFDGSVIPCCYYSMEEFDNVSNKSIIDIWNGEKLRNFRRLLLTDKRYNEFCGKCNVPDYNTDEKDVIDDYAEQLIEHFK